MVLNTNYFVCILTVIQLRMERKWLWGLCVWKQSLVCWNWERRDSLVAIIKELLDFYKEYQLQRIEQNTVMQRHFTSFLKFHPESLQVKVNKIEVSSFFFLPDIIVAVLCLCIIFLIYGWCIPFDVQKRWFDIYLEFHFTR